MCRTATVLLGCLLMVGTATGAEKPRTRLKASDPATWKRVPVRAMVPTGGVTLDDTGLFKPVMEHNIAYLLNSFSVDHMLWPFRVRAGQKNPPDDRPQVAFWDIDLRGSNAGRFLMGAGNTLRWIEHPELRKRLNGMIDGIESCREPNGYILAYPPDKTRSEEPNYGRAWFTHGLIEAAIAGNPKAYGLLRGHADWFNHWDAMLPRLINCCGNAHQGHIASTRTYFTPIGKPEDLQVAEKYYVQDWWMDTLAARQEDAVWKYPLPTPHSYLITSFEAYLDHYRATGDRKYLDAMLGAWALIHNKWEHVGGSMAICEGPAGSFPPCSYFLTPKGHTGETCGSVFWIKFNQRFHELFPEQEKYVNEIEKLIYNVCLPNQEGDKGIRYHARMEGTLDGPTMVNTCCEGQGTRFFGSLPEYIYSIADDGLYVNLYEPSSIAWEIGGQKAGLRMTTKFPFDAAVALRISVPRPMTMKLRAGAGLGRRQHADLGQREAGGRGHARHLPGTRSYVGRRRHGRVRPADGFPRHPLHGLRQDRRPPALRAGIRADPPGGSRPTAAEGVRPRGPQPGRAEEVAQADCGQAAPLCHRRRHPPPLRALPGRRRAVVHLLSGDRCGRGRRSAKLCHAISVTITRMLRRASKPFSKPLPMLRRAAIPRCR